MVRIFLLYTYLHSHLVATIRFWLTCPNVRFILESKILGCYRYIIGLHVIYSKMCSLQDETTGIIKLLLFISTMDRDIFVELRPQFCLFFSTSISPLTLLFCHFLSYFPTRNKRSLVIILFLRFILNIRCKLCWTLLTFGLLQHVLFNIWRYSICCSSLVFNWKYKTMIKPIGNTYLFISHPYFLFFSTEL